MKRSLMILIIIFLTTFSASTAESLNSEGKVQDVIPPKYIKEKMIKNEEVNYSNIIILGDLDLSDLPTKAVNLNLRIVNSTFRGSINFDDVAFGEAVDFSRSIFNDNISFAGAKFNKYVSFEGADFARDAKFSWSEFQGDANFKRTKFSNDEYYSSYFYETIFNSTAVFWKSQFGTINFEKAQFKDSSNFKKAEFLKDANFDYACFYKDSTFQFAKFLEKGLFVGTRFGGQADFQDASFEKDANFNSAVFNSSAFFAKAKFLENANFKDSIFKGIAQIMDVNSRGDAVFSNTTFDKNNLSLNGSKFSRIIARWGDLKEGLKFNEIIYSTLIKNFKDLGRTGDANDCYYDYRTQKPKEGLVDWAIDGLSWGSCGYGVKPIFTVFWCIVLIFSFAIIFWDGNGIKPTTSPQPDSIAYISKIFSWIGNQMMEQKNLKSIWESIYRIYDEELLKKIKRSSILKGAWNKMRTSCFLQCTYFSATVFVAAKSEGFSPRGRYKYLVTLERISGWFFFALFVGVMTRTILG